MKKLSALELVMYILAGLFGLVFIWFVISSFSYLSDYTAQYGTTIGAMFGEAMKYVIGQSLSYLAYGLLFFAAGRIIHKVDNTNQILTIAMAEEVCYDVDDACFGCTAPSCEGCEEAPAEEVKEEAPVEEA